MSEPAVQKPQEPAPRLKARLFARHDEAAQQGLVRIARLDALASLWSPVLTFALVFLPYVALIEILPAAVGWALPALRAVALLLLAWWVGLWVLRLARPKVEKARRIRRDARELLSLLDKRLAKLEGTLSPAIVEQVEAQGTKVQQAILSRDEAALSTRLAALQKLAAEKVPGMRGDGAGDFVGGLLKALVLALLVRTVFIEPYRIPSGSMLPTLQIGDHVFINKFIYGVRIPFTNVVPFQIIRAPERGDVVVFENPITGEDYIKRVIGVGGDVVEIRAGTIVINGEPQPRELLDPQAVTMNRGNAGWQAQPVRAFEETLGDVTYTTYQARGTLYRCPTEGPYRVPEGELFVMGDNRDASADSRYGLAPTAVSCDVDLAAYVPLGHVKGKAMVIWLAWGYDGLLSGLFGGSGLRLERLFLPVR